MALNCAFVGIEYMHTKGNKMKTTRYVYAKFCQYSTDNVNYVLLDSAVHEYDSCADLYKEFKFIRSVEVESLTREEVIALGINEFDEELFKLRQQIEAVENKKREMLALPMPEVE